MRFEWDPNKAAGNIRRHGVSFEEASTVFDDINALRIYAPDHSETEDRTILMWLSAHLRILVVCHCYREDDETVRIISGRKATARESKEYIRRK